jgi:hypothetical protein
LDGKPVERLPLALHAPDGWAVATTVTDNHGAYRFDRIKAGRYVLANVTSTGPTVALAPSATTADLGLDSLGREGIQVSIIHSNDPDIPRGLEPGRARPGVVLS